MKFLWILALLSTAIVLMMLLLAIATWPDAEVLAILVWSCLWASVSWGLIPMTRNIR